MQMGKLKELAVSLAVDFKAGRTGDGISALPNPTGGGREGMLRFINAPASLIRVGRKESKGSGGKKRYRTVTE